MHSWVSDMGQIYALFSSHFWKQGFSIRKLGGALLGAFGSLWLIVSVVSYFSNETGKEIQKHWYLFLILGITFAIWDNRPRLHVSCHIANRDVTLEIRVGDMFKMPGAFIVGATTSFDAEMGDRGISPKSVQGQFTSRCYDSVKHLQVDLSAALATETPIAARAGQNGQNPVYPVGTVARIGVRGQIAYLLAIASLNEHGVARATFEDLKTSLPKVWEYISTRGDLRPIIMPVLGSGYARVPQRREDIIREIIKSFIAACSSVRPTEKLTIAIPYKDFYSQRVDLLELERYLQHVCKYTEYESVNAQGEGAPITAASNQN
jgi:hypothetical protein